MAVHFCCLVVRIRDEVKSGRDLVKMVVVEERCVALRGENFRKGFVG